MAGAGEGSRRGGRGLNRWLGFLIAGVLLWFVGSNLPWRDTLTLGELGEPGAVEFVGEIQGDWKAERIGFVFDPDQPARGSGAPVEPELQDWVRGGMTIEATATTLRASAEQEELGGQSVSWKPGFPRAFSDLDLAGLLPAAGFLFLATVLVATRWWRLLAISGCAASWYTTFRLTYVGLFFNMVLPGSTGGDLARAYVVVRDHPERRADALMSVMVDRLLGLIAMALIATLAVFTNDERFAGLRLFVVGAFGSMILGLAAFLNPGFRRFIRFEALLARLPQARRLGKLDQALLEYARHPGEVTLALLLSCGNHLCATASLYWIGHAFGDSLSFHDYLCIATVANTLTAVPISPGGLGVGEVLIGGLFQLGGGMRLLGVASSFVYRLVLASLGLAGGVFLLLPGGSAMRREFREAGHD